MMKNRFERVKLEINIVKNTDKALFVSITHDELNNLIGETIWLPKSQIKVNIKDRKDINISRWLYDKAKQKMELIKRTLLEVIRDEKETESKLRKECRSINFKK